MAIFDFIASLIGIIFFGHVAVAPNNVVTQENLTVQQESTQAVEENKSTDAPSATQSTAVNTETSEKSLESNKIETLAKCLTANKAVFYGAYWCPHCQEQKSEFGDAMKYITYQECDAKGPNGNPEKCLAAGIEGYPTWILNNGEKLVGAQELETLAEKTNCPY